ncbi:nuclear pore complex protein Nup50 [Onychostruthus taczanowskii]|uniref:nuclear pore complex protein Nup50 n=1 Tax=Onychostruthus taczanowskii TaxID=356909 RepID=UPI001B80147E|nr:nuclear pore complex protein Nup50 [Onychostruthus taczanowskii]XP_041254450.1 nuclear pore complex protein Nup50 [Onychostruthus taczanowskii]XP_041254451.1 nuclear pore complex protein Nup50 [Onychostruthus taczanowskii]XP_041254452.1 nuclear pore complex protein Nup50 [Onychostruthus taczanowskii]XP_041254453.1 nuclear pore complex protein Nup50 [Onychostruthus taczanowskii]XP_041254454.1 nuclear pore complex protein Nup50 [Onychostruthus taczanowskii]
MAKRIAEKELTDRNWDQEDEAEEVGTFSVASEEVLKNRAIKKAKRRNVGSESESGGAFKGFKGFVLPSGKGGGGFSGFGNGAGIKPLEGLSNGSSSVSSTPPFSSLKSTSETQSAFASPVSNGPSAAAFAEKKAASPAANGGSQPCPSSGGAPSAGAYHKQLAALNRSVRDWIVKHVNSNPLCDLSPIFRDYERYLASIEQQHGGSSDSGSENEGAKTPGPRAAPAFGGSKIQQGSAFLFNSKTEDTSDKKPEAASEKRDPLLGATSTVSFNFGKSVDSSVLCSLGSGTLSSFSFSPGNSGLFGKDANQAKSVTAASASLLEAQTDSGNTDDKGGEEEEEEPPKVIVNEIKEDDAFYSKKCKLFYKKDNEFKEKGVGTLHLKPAGNEKTQLLVRADTNLGNILLNVLIPPKMPCSRTGKNNVLIVCVPNPPIDEKNPAVPVTMLIRVKTSEDADELHKILLEKKEA